MLSFLNPSAAEAAAGPAAQRGAAPGLLTWRCLPFADLSSSALYALLQLRAAVFVVEQTCAYLDPDGADPHCLHLWATDAQGRVAAAARLVPPGVKFAEASVGRVVTAPHARGAGLGHELVRRSLQEVQRRWGAQPLRIGAQAHLQAFYAQHGFVTVGEPYEEDGIAHVHMLRP